MGRGFGGGLRRGGDVSGKIMYEMDDGDGVIFYVDYIILDEANLASFIHDSL